MNVIEEYKRYQPRNIVVHAFTVRQFLDETVLDRGIGKRGSIETACKLQDTNSVPILTNNS